MQLIKAQPCIVILQFADNEGGGGGGGGGDREGDQIRPGCVGLHYVLAKGAHQSNNKPGATILSLPLSLAPAGSRANDVGFSTVKALSAQLSQTTVHTLSIGCAGEEQRLEKKRTKKARKLHIGYKLYK